MFLLRWSLWVGYIWSFFVCTSALSHRMHRAWCIIVASNLVGGIRLEVFSQRVGPSFFAHFLQLPAFLILALSLYSIRRPFLGTLYVVVALTAFVLFVLSKIGLLYVDPTALGLVISVTIIAWHVIILLPKPSRPASGKWLAPCAATVALLVGAYWGVAYIALDSRPPCRLNVSAAIVDMQSSCPLQRDSFVCMFPSALCERSRTENTRRLSRAMGALAPGQTLVIGEQHASYSMNGNVTPANSQRRIAPNTVLNFRGNLVFGAGWLIDVPSSVRAAWGGYNRTNPKKSFCDFAFYIQHFDNLTIVSETGGGLDGRGHYWWSLFDTIKFFDFDIDQGIFCTSVTCTARARPNLFVLCRSDAPCDSLTIRGVSFEDSAYWTTLIFANNVQVTDSRMVAGVRSFRGRRPVVDTFEYALRFRAFNTDGIDIIGDNVHIRNCIVDVEDDCVGIKGGNNWLVEDSIMSGAGVSIGTLEWGRPMSNVLVRNITFPETMRAIYIKPGAHHVANVVYEDIYIGRGFYFPIWIGIPYQEMAGACPLLWPFVADSTTITSVVDEFTTLSNQICRMDTDPSRFRNITLRNIVMDEALTAAFVIAGIVADLHLEAVDIPAIKKPFPESFRLMQTPECIRAGDKFSLFPNRCCEADQVPHAINDTHVCVSITRRRLQSTRRTWQPIRYRQYPDRNASSAASRA